MFRDTRVFGGLSHVVMVLSLALAPGSPLAATYANTATTFSWIDATAHTQVGYNTAPYKFNGTLGSSTCGTTPPTLDDTISDAIPIGFNFFFGDRSFDKLRILANGRVQFVGTSPAYDNTTCGYGSPVTQLPLPDAGLNYTLRIFGNDLDPSLQSEVAGYTTTCTSRTGANACFVSYASIGMTPNRRFVVTWNNVPEWAAASKTTGNYNIQIILQEDGDFIYQYGADSPGPGATTGEVGWQVSTTDYDKPSVGYPAANTAIRYFTPHPVVEYRMEEATWSGAGTVVDSSGFARDGSPVGSAQSTLGGKICRGASIPLAGTNAIDTGTKVATIGNAGMIAFWYKASTAWSGAGTQDAQLFDATTVNNQWFFLTRRGGTGANAGKLRFVVTDSTNTVRVVETPATSVAANTWKHIAVTWTFNNLVGGNNDRLTIYVDGVQQAQTTFTSTTATLSPQIDTLYLGGSRAGIVGSSGTANSADGTLDEFSAYNYEAPSAKINQVMNQISSICLAHYAISHNGTAPACLPPQFTVTAHNVGHAPVPVNTLINLSTSDNTGTWSLLSGRGVLTQGAVNSGTASYQFINESQAVFAFTHPAAGAVTAHVTDGNFGEQENAALTITSCGFGKFNACEVSTPKCTPSAASNAYGYLYTKLVNTAFTLDLVALSSGLLDTTFAKPVTVNLLANTNTPTLSGTTNCPTTQTATLALGSVNFSAGRASVAVPAVASAYRDVRVQFVCSTANCPPSGATACAPDAFSVRPPSLVVSSTANADNAGANTTATPKIATGATFTLTADSSTAGYNGIPNFDGTKAEWASPPTGGRPGGVGTAFGYFTTAATLATGNGASGNNFTYDEAGYFRLLAAGIYDPSYVGYSGDVGNGDCIANSYSNSAVGGKIGCLVANITPTNHFGRFIPDHFDEVLTHGCAGGAFTYSAQPFTLQLTARNSAGTTTQNYSQSFAKTVTLSDANAVVGGTMSSTSVAATAFTAGVATAKPAFAFVRATPDKAPATIKVHALDADGVASVGAAEKTTLIRIGRLMLTNAYGSEKVSLSLPVQAQYWTGKSWLLNGGDSCTTIPATSVALSNYLDGKGAAGAWTTTASGTVLAGGLGSIVLTAPNPAGSTGTVDVAVNLGVGTADQSCLAAHPAMAAPVNSLAWLRGKNGPCAASNTYTADPSARASFGVFPAEQRKAVHIRELY